VLVASLLDKQAGFFQNSLLLGRMESDGGLWPAGFFASFSASTVYSYASFYRKSVNCARGESARQVRVFSKVDPGKRSSGREIKVHAEKLRTCALKVLRLIVVSG
jgi:hypothetical protein